MKRPGSSYGYSNKRPRLATQINRAVRSMRETKYKNVDIIHLAVTNSTTTISDVSEGNGVSTRDGRKIMMLNCEVRMRVAGTNARVVIYVPKDPSLSLALTNDFDSVENDEFWVLHDRLYTGDGAGVFAINFRLHQPLGIEYAVTTGAAIKNPVKMLVQTSAASSVLGHTKLWYKDI